MSTFRKTAKGVQEIGTRSHGLPPRLRQLLVMVDGRRSDADLAALLPDSQAMLSTLAQADFIELVPGAPAAGAGAPRATPVPASAPLPARPQLPFAQRRTQAVRALTDAAGPLAETVAMKMERCQNAEELAPWLERAAQLVAQVRGAAQAEAFSRLAGLR